MPDIEKEPEEWSDVDYGKKKKFKEVKAKKDKKAKKPKKDDDDDDVDDDDDDDDGEDGGSRMLPPVEAARDVTLTRNYSQIVSKLIQRTDFPIFGGTNMSAGIDEGVEMLTGKGVRPYAQKVIILMSDGRWNAGRNPRDAAEDARESGVMIHVVTFLPQARSSDAEAVAKITGGRYFHADNEDQLIDAFEKIARTLPVVLTD